MATREESADNLVTAEFLRTDAEAARVDHRLIDGQLFVGVEMESPLSGESLAVEPFNDAADGRLG